MNVYLTVALCLCALVAFSDGVTVKIGDFTFPFESVKKVKYLLDAMPRSPRMRFKSLLLCGNPELPAEFRPLCSSPQAPRLVQELAIISRASEICEICANVACSGC